MAGGGPPALADDPALPDAARVGTADAAEGTAGARERDACGRNGLALDVRHDTAGYRGTRERRRRGGGGGGAGGMGRGRVDGRRRRVDRRRRRRRRRAGNASDQRPARVQPPACRNRSSELGQRVYRRKQPALERRRRQRRALRQCECGHPGHMRRGHRRAADCVELVGGVIQTDDGEVVDVHAVGTHSGIAVERETETDDRPVRPSARGPWTAGGTHHPKTPTSRPQLWRSPCRSDWNEEPVEPVLGLQQDVVGDPASNPEAKPSGESRRIVVVELFA